MVRASPSRSALPHASPSCTSLSSSSIPTLLSTASRLVTLPGTTGHSTCSSRRRLAPHGYPWHRLYSHRLVLPPASPGAPRAPVLAADRCPRSTHRLWLRAAVQNPRGGGGAGSGGRKIADIERLSRQLPLGSPAREDEKNVTWLMSTHRPSLPAAVRNLRDGGERQQCGRMQRGSGQTLPTSGDSRSNGNPSHRRARTTKT